MGDRQKSHSIEYRERARILRRKGWTLAAIGKEFGVSRQAIEQAIKYTPSSYPKGQRYHTEQEAIQRYKHPLVLDARNAAKYHKVDIEPIAYSALTKQGRPTWSLKRHLMRTKSGIIIQLIDRRTLKGGWVRIYKRSRVRADFMAGKVHGCTWFVVPSAILPIGNYLFDMREFYNRWDLLIVNRKISLVVPRTIMDLAKEELVKQGITNAKQWRRTNVITTNNLLLQVGPAHANGPSNPIIAPSVCLDFYLGAELVGNKPYPDWYVVPAHCLKDLQKGRFMGAWCLLKQEIMAKILGATQSTS